MKRPITLATLKIPAGTLKAKETARVGFTIARKGNKYRNTKCEWRGEKFDSKRELERHLVLLDMQKRGEIAQLERQPRYRLEVNGKHICDYVADWKYLQFDKELKIFHPWIVEDCKGYQTPDFKIKWKLVQALYTSRFRLS